MTIVIYDCLIFTVQVTENYEVAQRIHHPIKKLLTKE
jgi:hypothetical protein